MYRQLPFPQDGFRASAVPSRDGRPNRRQLNVPLRTVRAAHVRYAGAAPIPLLVTPSSAMLVCRRSFYRPSTTRRKWSVPGGLARHRRSPTRWRAVAKTHGVVSAWPEDTSAEATELSGRGRRARKAGDQGIEPQPAVLETAILAVGPVPQRPGSLASRLGWRLRPARPRGGRYARRATGVTSSNRPQNLRERSTRRCHGLVCTSGIAAIGMPERITTPASFRARKPRAHKLKAPSYKGL